jgi:CBS domain-containing protein
MAWKARDIMRSKDAVTVQPDMTVEELDRMLVAKGISGAPVVGEDGKLVGMVSQRDIIRFIDESLADADRRLLPLAYCLASKRVADIMTTNLRSVTPDTEVPAIARLLREHRIHRVLVVDKGKFLGLVTTLDLVGPFERAELADTVWSSESLHWTPFHHAREEDSYTTSAGRPKRPS